METEINFTKRKVGLWLAMIFVVVILSTGIFIAVNGFGTWKGNMQTAKDYMLIAGQQTDVAQTLKPVAVVKQVEIAKKTGQFICPIHGASGLPDYDMNGNQTCQICNRKMDVIYFK